MSDKKQEAEDRRDDEAKRRDDEAKRRQLDEPIPAGSDKRLEEIRRADYERRHQYEE